MAIPREIIEQIRERTDIVELISKQITLKRSGTGFTGLCPFHQEKTPSFHVEPRRGIFHCFGCGEGGDAIKFIMKTRGLSYPDAIKELATPLGIRIEERALSPEESGRIKVRKSLHDACEEAARYYQAVLLSRPEGLPGREYLKKRGITQETIQRFRIGFAPSGWTPLMDHLQSRSFTPEAIFLAGLAKPSDRGGYDTFRERVIFPILDVQDRVISFGGRQVPTGGPSDSDARIPKYLNGPETGVYSKSAVLYGLSQGRMAIQRKDRAILVEGYFDVVSLAQAGFEEAIATCGTALTPPHAEQLRRLTRNVVALFDSDEAGQRAAARSLPIFAEAGIEAHRLQLQGAKDPDELVREKGAEAFETALKSTIPLMEMMIRQVSDTYGPTPGGRQRAVEQLAPLLLHFPEISRSAWIRRIADVFSLPESVVLRQARPASSAPSAPAPLPSPNLATIPIEIRHLFWLLLHHPDAVSPLLRRCNPAWISDRNDVRCAIGGLLQGTSLSELLEDTPESDLRRLLCAAAIEEKLYPEQRVEAAAAQILASLELKSIKEALMRIHQELSTLELGTPRPTVPAAAQDDPELMASEPQATPMERALDLAGQRDILQRRLQELKTVKKGTSL